MTQKTGKKKTKAKKSRKLTPFLKLICFAVIAASIAMLVSVYKEVVTTFMLKDQLEEVHAKLDEVKDENEYLTREREKLENPDYVASYARGTYLLSKDGEQVFYLPEDDDR